MSAFNHVLEIAIFKVKPDFISAIPALRLRMREVLKDFPGFITFYAYNPMPDSNLFVDVLKWETKLDADAAAQAFKLGDARFLPYLNAIETLEFMSYFLPESPELLS